MDHLGFGEENDWGGVYDPAFRHAGILLPTPPSSIGLEKRDVQPTGRKTGRGRVQATKQLGLETTCPLQTIAERPPPSLRAEVALDERRSLPLSLPAVGL